MRYYQVTKFYIKNSTEFCILNEEGYFLDVRERIKLLLQNGVIGERSATISFKSLQWLSNQGVDLNSEAGQMFLTHFAMALERMFKGEKVEPLGDNMMDEIKESENYGTAKNFIDFIENNNQVKLPDVEKGYILLHLCNLIAKGGHE